MSRTLALAAYKPNKDAEAPGAYCGDVLASLAADGTIGLQDHLPEPFLAPQKDGHTLRIIGLVTQSSGLPHEMRQTGGTPENPYAGHTTAAQIDNLEGDPSLIAPGTGAFYSNFGFDLLDAAMADAGRRTLNHAGWLLRDGLFDGRPGIRRPAS